MLPILRSRPSQILVALLCAMVLSRMPAPVFAEDAISSLVKIEETTPLDVLAAHGIEVPSCDSAIAIRLHIPVQTDIPNHSTIELSILRL